ncbi:MAG: UPF0149 family protein [Candidatus Thiodiazotropha sp. (ex Myrtea spinifera)]|nr:UPF0149 family protein [Candidatus Thiodiazotropha sp. (ex Myrtea spinifera)]MCU7827551.1 UPF0149 family protein [Candidatus Thiodiazotropha sp. (ex Myrtea sp. 'scaly one' KF741663)]
MVDYEPLNEEEMDELDRFLLERIEDADKAEGLFGLSELDGFFTAVASGPEVVPPSVWLPAVWGEDQPVWETAEGFEKIFQLMVRHYNDVVRVLAASEFEFGPVFSQHEVDGNQYTVVDEWCFGYMQGIALCADAWEAGGDELFELLQPILLFSGEPGWEVLDTLSEEDVNDLKASLPGAAQDIHHFWLARRSPQPVEARVMNQPESHPGLDAPCVCGSGKPFRKCCLH